jgi:flagellar biosynthesis protein FlhB
MSSAQEKTEKPTGKKISEARKRGKVAKSRETNSTVVLMGGGLGIFFSTGIIYDHFRQMMFELWGHGFSAVLDSPPGSELLLRVASHFAIMVLPACLSALLVAVVVNLFQTNGFSLSMEAIKPDLSKLSPLQGLKRLLSLRSFMELGKSIIKMTIVGYSVYAVFRSENQFFLPLISDEILNIAKTFGYLASKVLMRVCGAMFFVSILDIYYQRWQHQKDLKMTKQEVKEEQKQSEGNPEIKSRIRSLQRTIARRRMMAAVPKASVVITNPTHYAVALLYEPKMEAPKILAKGVNLVALNIIKTARKHRIPVVQNPPLARALYSEVEVDETVPVTLYKAVAKVLAYIYQQRGRKPS